LAIPKFCAFGAKLSAKAGAASLLGSDDAAYCVTAGQQDAAMIHFGGRLTVVIERGEGRPLGQCPAASGTPVRDRLFR